MTTAAAEPHATGWHWHGPTITFVVPWYGEQVAGGAEVQARRLAEELCARGIAAEVFATTAGGLNTDWSAPAYPAGSDLVNGVPVRRFAVRPRNAAAFDALNLRLLRGERLSLLEEAVFVREIIGSDELEAAIAAEAVQRLYIFTPYMFGTSYWGARATQRPYLIPCLHDEPYAMMQLYAQLFETASGLLFYSPAEQRLARQLYDLPPERLRWLGGGIETDLRGDAARFRRSYSIKGPFLLYAGRRDPTKNTPLLFDYLRRYRAEGGTLRLVCIGGSGQPVPPDLLASGAVLDLGFVPVQDKYDACAAASVLCQPSRNESFSIVIMEAWVCGTPVLVHSDCAVTREFAELSGGGLHFRSYAEFVGCLEWLATHPDEARRMGAAGGGYVRRHFTWEAVLARLLGFLQQAEARPRTGARW
jgi:glycosyltransferase involved in cell wall biosynthesis